MNVIESTLLFYLPQFFLVPGEHVLKGKIEVFDLHLNILVWLNFQLLAIVIKFIYMLSVDKGTIW